MKCPACNSQLHEYKAGTLCVDICRDGCSGIWFDKAEFEKCDQHTEPFPPELLRIRKQASVVIDRNKARSCPKCVGKTLKHIVIDPEIRFEIDECPACGGHWLDIGELEHIRSTDKDTSAMHARIAAFEKKVEAQLKSSDKAFKLRSLIQLITR